MGTYKREIFTNTWTKHSKMANKNYYAQKVSEDLDNSDEFWKNSREVVEVGRVFLRPGLDMYSDEICYYFKRVNKAPRLPSIVKLSRKNVQHLSEWIKEIFRILDSDSYPDKESLSMEKDDPAFWTTAYNLVQSDGDFRIRPVQSGRNISFCMNNFRSLEKFSDWCGPVLFTNRSELRILFEKIEMFEKKFEI